MCMEVTKGHKRVYRSANEAFDVTDDKAGCAFVPIVYGDDMPWLHPQPVARYSTS